MTVIQSVCEDIIERRPAVGSKANYLLKAKIQRLIVCYCEKSIMQSLSVWSKGTSWAHCHHLASLWKPVSLFEDPPNKKHKAKHRCSWNVAPLILALSRKLMLCWMALRKRLLEAWLALKPPQVSAWGSSISAASLSPVQTFLFRGQEAFSNYTSWKTSAVCAFLSF